jgi:hypothetical protein
MAMTRFHDSRAIDGIPELSQSSNSNVHWTDAPGAEISLIEAQYGLTICPNFLVKIPADPVTTI